MSRGRFIELPATLPRSAGADRSLAQRIWHMRAAVPTLLQRRAAHLAEQTPDSPGRVHDLGCFEDEIGRQVLGTWLPGDFGAALGPKLQWYGCRGAGFHSDAHYSAVLFGAWCLAGPPRSIVFAEPELRVACPTGELVVFDPFQPHAVLDSDQGRYERERYVATAANVFLAFELELTPSVRERFGIGPAEPGALTISSSTAVNAETGEIVR